MHGLYGHIYVPTYQVSFELATVYAKGATFTSTFFTSKIAILSLGVPERGPKIKVRFELGNFLSAWASKTYICTYVPSFVGIGQSIC